MHGRRPMAIVLVAVAMAVLADCGSAVAATNTHAAQSSSGRADTSTGRVMARGRAPFSGHGSIGQAYIVGAPPGTKVTLLNAHGRVVGKGTIDYLGALIIRNVTPGPGYTFRTVGRPRLTTAPFRVLSVNDTPPPSFYSSQHLQVGLNYITMRDGVKLAATVRLPPGKTLADGPFPTVIEESGYAIAAPHSLIDALFGIDGETLSDPLLPDTATAVGSVIAPLLGFATVSLQMRGTGCSGGAFDLFGLPTTYDGYDAVQIVASQPWVAHHKVGMVGISFSGISQMFVAGTRPPGLAAIAPMSLTDDLYSTGFPGGLFNTGFAASWLEQRIQDAEPAPQGGQEWAKVEIADGDQTCLANQALHAEDPEPDFAAATGEPLREIDLRPAVGLLLGPEGRRPGLRVGGLPGRTDGRAVAGHPLGSLQRPPRLGDHRQRDPRRFVGARHHRPVARVPRHLRGRPGAERAAPPHLPGPAAVPRTGQCPRRTAAAAPIRQRAKRGRRPSRLRAPAPSPGALRQRQWKCGSRGLPARLEQGLPRRGRRPGPRPPPTTSARAARWPPTWRRVR